MELTEKEQEQCAINIIRNYLNKKTLTDDYIKTNYAIAIKLIIENLNNTDINVNNISSITQGSQSITYNNNVDSILTDYIKNLLPRPFIQIF